MISSMRKIAGDFEDFKSSTKRRVSRHLKQLKPSNPQRFPHRRYHILYPKTNPGFFISEDLQYLNSLLLKSLNSLQIF